MPKPGQLWLCWWVDQQVGIRPQECVALARGKATTGRQLPAQKIPKPTAGYGLQVLIPAPVKMGLRGKGCKALT